MRPGRQEASEWRSEYEASASHNELKSVHEELYVRMYVCRSVEDEIAG